MITLSAIVGLSTLLLIHSSRSLRNSEIAIPIFLDRCRVALNWALPQSVWRNGSILARNNSGPARPYMARLSVFRRLI